MFICHQPYSEIQNIPFGEAEELMQVGISWLDNIFSMFKRTDTDIGAILRTIPPPSQWKKE